ncbi:hypothetical protein BC941DRAFT_477300 [Chlamydoabsidia padenii]|nr:hypothetical protein BC941DRAFT_477300 [Chlamydoabsidia padenii]
MTPITKTPYQYINVASAASPQRQSTPSPPGSITEKVRVDTSKSPPIQRLQRTIKTLQATIEQVATLIAELTPLQQTVSKLQKRVNYLEMQNIDMTSTTDPRLNMKPPSLCRTNTVNTHQGTALLYGGLW